LTKEFYLASSAVIPILALAAVIQDAVVVLPAKTTKLTRGASKAGQLLALALVSGVSIWGELVCLRSLELTKSWLGGPVAVWVALGVLTVYIVLKRGVAICRSKPRGSS
jgi:hypothetical protein